MLHTIAEVYWKEGKETDCQLGITSSLNKLCSKLPHVTNAELIISPLAGDTSTKMQRDTGTESIGENFSEKKLRKRR